MIEINEKYAISSDKNQWMILQKVKQTPKKPSGWEPIKYYPNLQMAVDALQGLLLRTSEYGSFSELSANAREISRLLDRKLKVSL